MFAVFEFTYAQLFSLSFGFDFSVLIFWGWHPRKTAGCLQSHHTGRATNPLNNWRLANVCCLSGKGTDPDGVARSDPQCGYLSDRSLRRGKQP